MSRVAVLVDGDNVSPDFAQDISGIGQRLGDVQLHRVYANAIHGSGWNDVPGVRLIHAGNGKNSADLLLSIEAIEFACMDGYETFLLASSDGDFTHLATRLRERGHRVVGTGETKAPSAFRAACTSFEELVHHTIAGPEPARTDPARVSAAARETAKTAVTELDHNIRDVIKRNSVNGSGMRLSDLNARLHAEHEIRISAHPERNWRTYFGLRPALYDLDPRGPDAHVRFRPGGFNV